MVGVVLLLLPTTGGASKVRTGENIHSESRPKMNYLQSYRQLSIEHYKLTNYATGTYNTGDCQFDNIQSPMQWYYESCPLINECQLGKV